MADEDCIAFLQWCLPRLGLRWTGFRRVRRQVCRRLRRRLAELGLAGFADYRRHLEGHAAEWRILDGFCRVTISRFFRDREVFRRLREEVLPGLARRATARGETRLRCWCAGCASGEEVWSLRVLWDLALAPAFPGLALKILGTDVDLAVLARARRACYGTGSLREMEAAWRERAFERRSGLWCVRAELRHDVALALHDVRRALPTGRFHLLLCRNLVFTYFAAAEQLQVGARLLDRLEPGGCLLVGSHETLPAGLGGAEVSAAGAAFYRRAAPGP